MDMTRISLISLNPEIFQNPDPCDQIIKSIGSLHRGDATIRNEIFFTGVSFHPDGDVAVVFFRLEKSNWWKKLLKLYPTSAEWWLRKVHPSDLGFTAHWCTRKN